MQRCGMMCCSTSLAWAMPARSWGRRQLGPPAPAGHASVRCSPTSLRAG